MSKADLSEESQAILRVAKAKEKLRWATSVPIDYQASQREFVAQKAALTRALNSGDPNRVIIACKNAVDSWSQPGRMWPDDWSRWQCALDASLGFSLIVSLEDLGSQPSAKLMAHVSSKNNSEPFSRIPGGRVCVQAWLC